MSISSKIEHVKSVETKENSVIPATASIDEDSCTETDSSQCSLQSNSFEDFSNQVQADYISQAAHDLNTPLQSFQLSLELLRQSTLTVPQDDILQQASVAVVVMKRTIQCALDAQRLSAGFSLQPHIALINLCDVNNRVSTFMQCARFTPAVLFQASPDVYNSVYTDDEWLCQILTTVIEQSQYKATDCPISVNIRTAEASKPWCVDATPARVLLFEISFPSSIECLTWPELNYCASPSFGTPSSTTSDNMQMNVMRARIEALQGACGTYVTAGKGSVIWFALPYVPVPEKQLVVAVTANGAEFKDLLGAGFDAVYPKPVSRKTLLTVVADYLDNKWQTSFI
eukprot:gene18773-21365_t